MNKPRHNYWKLQETVLAPEAERKNAFSSDNNRDLECNAWWDGERRVERERERTANGPKQWLVESRLQQNPDVRNREKTDTETPLNSNCSKEAFCKIWTAQQATWRKRIERGFSISCSFIQILFRSSASATAAQEKKKETSSHLLLLLSTIYPNQAILRKPPKRSEKNWIATSTHKSLLPDDHDEGWLTSLVFHVLLMSPAEKYQISQFKRKTLKQISSSWW